MDLQKCAREAFAAIRANTGEDFPHGTVSESFESFRSIVSSKGLAWLIDAATGCGMSHMGYAFWMAQARDELAT